MNKSAAALIARNIERMISEGELTPDRKIPSERQLASRLGVSRAVVREAIHELQGRGVIETVHGRGSFVTCAIPEPEGEIPLSHLVDNSLRSLIDLFEVREQLEGQAALLAAERGTQADLYKITKAFNALDAIAPLADADLDHAFHNAIANASHNVVLVHILASIKSLTLKSIQTSLTTIDKKGDLKVQITKHHRQIYHAIINREPLLAQKAAVAHVRYVRVILENFACERPPRPLMAPPSQTAKR